MALLHPTASSSRFLAFVSTAGGIAAFGAGLCWAVKAVAIIATGRQPPLLFSLAPVLMAFAVLSLSRQLPTGRHRTISTYASGTALLAGGVVLVNEVTAIPAVGYGFAMASATLLTLVGLVSGGLSLRRRMMGSLPLTIGLATVPAVLAGGLAAEVLGERALEIPLVVLGAAWMGLGVRLAQGEYRRADSLPTSPTPRTAT